MKKYWKLSKRFLFIKIKQIRKTRIRFVVERHSEVDKTAKIKSIYSMATRQKSKLLKKKQNKTKNDICFSFVYFYFSRIMSNRNQTQSQQRNETSVSRISTKFSSRNFHLIFKNEQENVVANNSEQTPSTTNNAQPAAAAAARPRQSPWEIIKSFLVRMVFFYFISQLFRRSSTPNSAGNVTLPANPNTGYAPGNLFIKGDLLDMYLFINEDETYVYDPLRKPNWEIDAMKYGDWSQDGTYTKFVEFPISKNVQNNGSLYLHVVVTKHGLSIDPSERESHSAQYVFYKSKRKTTTNEKTK